MAHRSFYLIIRDRLYPYMEINSKASKACIIRIQYNNIVNLI